MTKLSVPSRSNRYTNDVDRKEAIRNSKRKYKEKAKKLGIWTNKERKAEKQRRYRKRYIYKTRVHGLTAYYKKTGILVAPESCERCYQKKRLIAHHDDYTKVLDVKWLCVNCHNEIHGKAKIKVNY